MARTFPHGDVSTDDDDDDDFDSISDSVVCPCLLSIMYLIEFKEF